MLESLKDAVEGVYKAFREVPKPTKIDGCPCCIDEKKICVLIAKPLRELTPDDLTNYASSVFLTVGAVEDFLYFLPRLLEILVTDPGWWPDPEVVTRAIDTSGFFTWPVVRRDAVLRYFDGVIDDLLATDGSGWQLDSWICALGRLHLDLAPFLTRIRNNGARLIELCDVNGEALQKGELRNSFWEEAPQEAKEFVDWIRSAETQSAILKHYEQA